MKAEYWVVTGNGSKIVLYQWSSVADALREQTCLRNPENQRLKFVQRVAEVLDEGRVVGSYAWLIIAVSNPFLGELLSGISKLTKARVGQSYAVDVTMLPTTELESWLRHRQHAGLPED